MNSSVCIPGYAALDSEMLSIKSGPDATGATPWLFQLLATQLDYRLFPSTEESSTILKIVRGSNRSSDKLPSVSGTRYVVWIHNHISRERLEYYSKHDLVAKIVFCGYNQAARALALCFSPKYIIIPNPAPIPLKSPANNYTNDDVVSVAYLGALKRQKGIIEFFRYVKEVDRRGHAQRRTKIIFNILGSSYLYSEDAVPENLDLYHAHQVLEPDIYEQICSEGLLNLKNDELRFHGKCSRARKAELLSQSDIGIFNITGNTECLPISSLELQAYGLFVLSMKRMGNVDSVDHKVCGKLSWTTKQLIKELEACANQILIIRGTRQARSNLCLSTFSQEQFIRKWNSTLLEILSPSDKHNVVSNATNDTIRNFRFEPRSLFYLTAIAIRLVLYYLGVFAGFIQEKRINDRAEIARPSD